MSFAFVFPGQGSQKLNMMGNLEDLAIVKNIFGLAKDVLEVDFLAMLHEETPANINHTINTQPLMLCAGYATYMVWKERTNRIPFIVAGHSLGEWTALVVSEVLTFEDALKLVKLRASLMQNVVKKIDSAMVAVLGLEDEKVISICSSIERETGGVVAGVNFNSPGQVVIAGDVVSVGIASLRLEEAGAKKVQILPVSVPSHCKLMKPAADLLKLEMEKFTFKTPQINILHNVNAQIYKDVTDIKEALAKQLYSPVLWTVTIRYILAQGISNVIECGPGKVLSGLNKRIDTRIASYSINSMEDIEKINIGI